MEHILIISDTHNSINDCIKLIQNTKDITAIIHAGDCVSDAEDLKSIFPDIPIFYVKGNNDFYSHAPYALTANINGKKIYVVHGHEQRVKYDMSLSALKSEGEARGADLIVFGHTHVPQTEYFGKMIILNPGSARFTHTYAIAEIDGDMLKTELMKF